MYIETEEQARELFVHAPYRELESAIESAWHAYALAPAIAKGSRVRPVDALCLAASALKHSNLVIQRTALLMLQAISTDPILAESATRLLHEHFEWMKQQGRTRDNEPALWYWEETLAWIEGRHDAYLEEKQAQYRHLEPQIEQITDGKKASRLNAILTLGRAKDPYFTGAIARALDDAEDKNVKAALDALAAIRGFDAIPKIAGMLRGFWSRQALETLAALGDRSALTHIFDTLENSAAPAHILDLLSHYGRLAVFPLIAALKKCDHPEAYKNGFASVVAALRCDALADALLREAEQDAGLSENIARLLEKMYPKQLKKRAKTPLKAIAPLVSSAFGGKIVEVGARCEFALTPDGATLAYLAHGKSVTLLDARTGEARGSLAACGHPRVMALSPDGAYLLTAAYTNQRDYLVQVWKWGEWGRSLVDIAHQIEIKTLAMSWDARFLLISDMEKVRIVECGFWQDAFTFAGHPIEPAPPQPLPIAAGYAAYRPFTFLQAMPNSASVLIGDWLGWLSVLEMGTWREIAWLKSDSWAPKFAELSADGTRLAYAGHVGIRLWETATWQEQYAAAAPNGFDYMTLTPDGRHLVVEKNKKIRFLDMRTWKEAFAFDSSPVSQLRVSPDGGELYLSSSRNIQAWSLALLHAA